VQAFHYASSKLLKLYKFNLDCGIVSKLFIVTTKILSITIKKFNTN